MSTYNGHKSWAHWNVCLWIYNDEALYCLARTFTRKYGLDRAALEMMLALEDLGISHTPDGAKYSKTAIRAALKGM